MFIDTLRICILSVAVYLLLPWKVEWGSYSLNAKPKHVYCVQIQKFHNHNLISHQLIYGLVYISVCVTHIMCLLNIFKAFGMQCLSFNWIIQSCVNFSNLPFLPCIMYLCFLILHTSGGWCFIFWGERQTNPPPDPFGRVV